MSLSRRFVATFLGVTLSSFGCSGRPSDTSLDGSAAVRLKPAVAPIPDPAVRHTVYVPVYSSIFRGTAVQNTVELAATLSIRNVSSEHPLVLESVRYHDSTGHRLRDHVTRPAVLGPLATVEFVIRQADTAGGPGASFLVQWAGAADIDEPVIEAVMIGDLGNWGFSFISPGRPIKTPPQP
jgi:hypothetical protein